MVSLRDDPFACDACGGLGFIATGIGPTCFECAGTGKILPPGPPLKREPDSRAPRQIVKSAEGMKRMYAHRDRGGDRAAAMKWRLLLKVLRNSAFWADRYGDGIRGDLCRMLVAITPVIVVIDKSVVRNTLINDSQRVWELGVIAYEQELQKAEDEEGYYP